MKSSLPQLGVVIVLCGISGTGLWLWYAIIAQQSAEVALLQQQIHVKSGAIARIATAQTVFTEIEKDEQTLRGYLVSEGGVVSFIDMLEEKGRLLGTTVNVLSVSASGSSAFPVLELTLAIKGSFDSVMRTVGSIEYAPYAISVQTLFIGKDAKDEWLANIKMQVVSAPSSKATKKP